MSIFTNFENWWATTEADVLAAIAQLRAGFEVLEADIAKAIGWVNNNIPQINAEIGQINGALQTVAASGVVKIPPAVGTAIADANKAVAALNAYSDAVNSGGSQTAALIAGYTAIKTAQSATALATLAVIAVPPVATGAAAGAASQS